eukprot:ANDGO_00613.mRNA.1 hypothetical protein
MLLHSPVVSYAPPPTTTSSSSSSGGGRINTGTSRSSREPVPRLNTANPSSRKRPSVSASSLSAPLSITDLPLSTLYKLFSRGWTSNACALSSLRVSLTGIPRLLNSEIRTRFFTPEFQSDDHEMAFLATCEDPATHDTHYSPAATQIIWPSLAQTAPGHHERKDEGLSRPIKRYRKSMTLAPSLSSSSSTSTSTSASSSWSSSEETTTSEGAETLAPPLHVLCPDRVLETIRRLASKYGDKAPMAAVVDALETAPDASAAVWSSPALADYVRLICRTEWADGSEFVLLYSP